MVQVTTILTLTDSKRLALGDKDGNILFWDLSNPEAAKQLGLKLSGHHREVSSLAYLPDSRVLVSGGLDGRVRLWDYSLLSLKKLACQIISRNFTRAEWNQYLGQYYGEADYHKTCPDLPAGD